MNELLVLTHAYHGPRGLGVGVYDCRAWNLWFGVWRFRVLGEMPACGFRGCFAESPFEVIYFGVGGGSRRWGSLGRVRFRAAGGQIKSNDFRSENGSSQGQILVFPVLYLPSSLENGLRLIDLCITQLSTLNPLSTQCRGTWLIRNNPLLGPYSRTMSRAIWWP